MSGAKALGSNNRSTLLVASKIPNNLPVVALYNSNVVPGCTNVVWGMYSSGKPNNMR